ncbi:suppressor APC domain-containing protein 1 isoform X1 [Triplophysa dalaica]|uniref:suppressor APC domain-containing protein 1 isoform X1 n=1 Tax=Triplophysa dalaica TaxID=1582913 RepID=UPI0024DF886F|nr:suppressor APC domain-containing protein 1 isoform X1 [Triplophysa dalaica]
MAFDSSYAVLIIPLQNSIYSPDALHCFLWLKRRQDLEREKDSLWAGLQALEQAQLWYQSRLKLNSQSQSSSSTGYSEREGRCSCALRSCLQRVNGSLGTLMSDTSLRSHQAPEETGGSDWALRWTNTTLVKEVIKQNLQISMLELEKARLQQLVSSSTSV